MSRLSIFLIFYSFIHVPAAAQPALSLSSTSASAGSAVTLNLSLSSPAGSEPSAIQWTLNYPPASLSNISVIPGATLAPVGKTLQCVSGSGSYTCIAYGMNATILPDGVVAQVVASPATAGTVAIGFSALAGSSPAGDSEPIAGVGGTITVPSSPAITLNPSALTFQSQSTGTTSAAQAVTVTNSGNSPVTFSSIALTGANPGDFAISNDTCVVGAGSLAASASCSVGITFSPTANGTRTAAVTFTDNASGSPQSVGLTGTGQIATYTLSFNPGSLTFALQNTRTTSAAQSITVNNTGNSPVMFSLIALTGANPGDFAISGDTCPVGTGSLTASSSCSVSVTFSPTANGSRTAAILFTDNATASPQSLSLSGTGQVPTFTLNFNPSSLTFALQNTGTTSAAQIATVTNNGNSPVTFSSIALTGADPSDYAISADTCPVGAGSLAASASCSMSITFSPTANGIRTAAVTFTDNASGSPQSVGLAGTGQVPSSTLQFNPSSLTFALQDTSTTSAAQAVTVTNSANSPLKFSSITLTGANPGDFAISKDTCSGGSASLAAGASCKVSVTFSPSTTGTRAAAITLTDNTGGSPQSVGLNGTGQVPTFTLNLNPSSLTFALQNAGTTSAAQAVTVTNSGNSPVAFSSITLIGANPGDFVISKDTCSNGSASLAVGASCKVSVTFSPSTAGTRTAAITFTDKAGGSPQSVGLSGTGVATWPNGYTYEATFAVAAGKMPSAQTNFPALLSGTFADFATIANGGKVANTCTQTVGNNSITVPCDLIFSSDPAGSMPLKWEFETYNAATGAVNIWVNVPLIGDGTVIYGWYGRPTVTTLQTTSSATWNSNFEAVYHLSEIPTQADPQMNDSTANANHATMQGTIASSQQQPGLVGGSINFDGQTYATLANAEKFNFGRTDSFSLSGWFKLPSGQSSYSSTLLSKFPSIPNAGWALLQGPNGPAPSAFGLILFGNGGNNGLLADTPGVTTGVWHYLVATYSGTSTVAGVQIFVDGVSQPLTALTNTLNATTVNTLTPQMNGRNGSFQLSADSMDEIRISAKGVVLTPGWVTASYNNQSDPSAFFTVTTGLTN